MRQMIKLNNLITQESGDDIDLKKSAIMNIGGNHWEIRVPELGVFTSSDVDNLKRILDSLGYNWYMRVAIISKEP